MADGREYLFYGDLIISTYGLHFKVFPFTGHRPSTIDHRPSTIDHRPSTIGHRPSTIGHRPSTIGHRPSTTGHRPSAIAAPSLKISKLPQ
jgi:hypothetical protein